MGSSEGNRFESLYRKLLCAYGPQGWWPLAAHRSDASTGRLPGYHPGDYASPGDAAGRFEVAVGAVLTQNTAWSNVERALVNLRNGRLLNPSRLLAAGDDVLRNAVRASGYYNQKARKLKLLAEFFRFREARRERRPPARGELLAIWGVGHETADSILLYAFHEPVFVIDAYTRRLMARLGWADERASYAELQALFQAALPPDHRVFKEYHALIVEHAKRHCRKKPVCAGCPVRRSCARFRASAPGPGTH